VRLLSRAAEQGRRISAKAPPSFGLLPAFRRSHDLQAPRRRLLLALHRPNQQARSGFAQPSSPGASHEVAWQVVRSSYQLEGLAARWFGRR